MRLLPTPKLSSIRDIAIIAFALTLVDGGLMFAQYGGGVAREFRDTDDAMRLVLARDLLHGRGWFDQLVTRIDPPDGVFFHWSRLVDGGLAAAMWLAGRFLSSTNAELVVRIVWPMLWVFPAVMAALVIARNLGTRSAVVIGAVLMAIELQLYRQFRPGRIDHHNIQITFALIAMAVATVRDLRPRMAAVAGFASGLGLAVGLEALPFQAIIGASFALRLAIDRTQARAIGAYGIALSAASAGFYVLQTPSSRWGMSFCDAMAINLVASLCVAGLGITGIAALSARWPSAWRWSSLALVGLAVTATYLFIEPICIHGPFAAVDPRLQQIFFDRIQELQSWTTVFAQNQPVATHSMTAMVMALLSAICLWWRNRLGIAETLALVVLTVACVTAFRFERMEDYSFWFGFPILAAGLSYVAQRWLDDRMLPVVLMSVVLSPIVVGGVLAIHFNYRSKEAGAVRGVSLSCNDVASYAHLAHLPPGLVLADFNLGSLILADTPHDIVSAPYHRMSKQILAAYDALNANSARAESAVRHLRAGYIVDCSTTPDTSQNGLLTTLRSGMTPPWLTRLSGRGEAIEIWRVNPLLPHSGR
jgi:hypothetical protein